jgi:hypothetical protein
LIVHQPGSDTTTAFLSQVNGRTLTFAAANAEATELTDGQTHSRWDAYGLCVSGPLHGSRLQSLILEPEYWFAWSEFHPNTGIYVAKTAPRYSLFIDLKQPTECTFIVSNWGARTANRPRHQGCDLWRLRLCAG